MTPLRHERIDELHDSFSLFDNWEDRYGYLIDLGKALPPMPEDVKTEETRIQGCQSRVWLAISTSSDDHLLLACDSDSAIVKGLAAILWRVYNELPVREVLEYDVEGLFDELELGEHLSMNRRTGLRGMIAQIRTFALMAGKN